VSIHAEFDCQRRLIGLALKGHNDQGVRTHWRKLCAQYPLSEWHTQEHRIIAGVISDAFDGGPTNTHKLEMSAILAAHNCDGCSTAKVLTELSECHSMHIELAKAQLYSDPLIESVLGRRLQLIVDVAGESMHSKHTSTIDVYREMREQGDAILEAATRPSIATSQQAAVEAAIKQRQSPQGNRVPLPWANLARSIDAKNPGLAPGLHVWAARPKVGKSGAWEQLVVWLGREHGIPSTIVSLEMTKTQHIERMASRELANFWRESGRSSSAEVDLNLSIGALADLPLTWFDESDMSDTSWRGIRTQLDATRASQRKPALVVVIDNLMNIYMDPKKQTRLAIAQAVSGAHSWGLTHGVAVIMIHHLSRELEKGSGLDGAPVVRRPRMSDLAECAGVERSAASILLFDRPSASGHKEADVIEGYGERCNIVVISRTGPSEYAKMWFDGPTISWHERESGPIISRARLGG